jgi:hypothetical protein
MSINGLTLDTESRASVQEEMRLFIVERLRARRTEIEQTIFRRLHDGVPSPVADDEYLHGVRGTVAASLDYILTGLEAGEGSAASVPQVVLAQARRAARQGVGVDVVLRRCVAGYVTLEDFIMQEADHSPLWTGGGVRHVLAASAALLDCLIVPITAAYSEEISQFADSGVSMNGRGNLLHIGIAVDNRVAEGSFHGDGAIPGMFANPSASRPRECLLFLDDHPGSSNREIAAGVGVVHPPQISKLLRALAGEGLVTKRSEGLGKRNAWQLTPRGEGLSRMLAEGVTFVQ